MNFAAGNVAVGAFSEQWSRCYARMARGSDSLTKVGSFHRRFTLRGRAACKKERKGQSQAFLNDNDASDPRDETDVTLNSNRFEVENLEHRASSASSHLLSCRQIAVDVGRCHDEVIRVTSMKAMHSG